MPIIRSYKNATSTRKLHVHANTKQFLRPDRSIKDYTQKHLNTKMFIARSHKVWNAHKVSATMAPSGTSQNTQPAAGPSKCPQNRSEKKKHTTTRTHTHIHAQHVCVHSAVLQHQTARSQLKTTTQFHAAQAVPPPNSKSFTHNHTKHHQT